MNKIILPIVRMIAIILLLLPSFHVNALDKIQRTAISTGQDYTDLIESMLPSLPEWRIDQLRECKEACTPLQFSTVALDYALRYNDKLWTHESDTELKRDSLMNAIMMHIAYFNEWNEDAVPRVLNHYTQHMYKIGYVAIAALWARLGEELCIRHKWFDVPYMEMRSLSCRIRVDSFPDDSMHDQRIILNYMKDYHAHVKSEVSYATLVKHYIRMAEIALAADRIEFADSIKEELLDFLYHRKDPDVISGKVSVGKGTSVDMFIIQSIESRILLSRGDVKGAMDKNETVVWRFLDNMAVKNLLPEHFPYFFDAIEFMAIHNQFHKSNYELLLYASEYVKSYLSNISNNVNAELRNKYYKDARHTIELINSQLLKFISKPGVITALYDNLILFKGLGMTMSTELKKGMAEVALSGDTAKIEGQDDNVLLGLIRGQYRFMYRHVDALNRSGLKDWIKMDFKSVLESLSDDEVAVEFFYDKGKKHYYAIIVHDGLSVAKVVPLISSAELSSGASSSDFYTNSKWYKKIWGPVVKQLPSHCQRIYFSPDGEFHRLAIENLAVDMDRIGCTINDGYEVHRISSIKETLTPRVSTESDCIVLSGGIDYGESTGSEELRGLFDNPDTDATVASLEASRLEVEEIGELFAEKGWDVRIQSGNVMKDEILNYEMIPSIEHISTHGFFIDDKSLENTKVRDLKFLHNLTYELGDSTLLRSGLVISGANEIFTKNDDRGIVTAADIAWSDKRGVDLVVLSTCVSGQGVVTGDGIHGLIRGYKIAGANSIIAALWEVDDWVTKEFMKEFYTNYLNGDSKRVALLKAQKYIREFKGVINGKSRNLSSPKYWAPFILIDG